MQRATLSEPYKGGYAQSRAPVSVDSSVQQLLCAFRWPKKKSQKKGDWIRSKDLIHNGGDLLEIVFTFFGTFGGVYARFRTNAVHLHVGAQGYGLVRGHYAEQWPRRGSEDHCHAVERNRTSAKRANHEPKRDDQGTNVQVVSVWESESPGAWSRGQEKRTRQHYGGCITGSVRYTGPTGADVTNPETETGELGGRCLSYLYVTLKYGGVVSLSAAQSD